MKIIINFRFEKLNLRIDQLNNLNNEKNIFTVVSHGH